MIRFAAVIFFVALATALIRLSQFVNDLRPTWPEPEQTTIIAGKKCAVYQGTWRAAPLFAVLCDDGSVRFARDWRYADV